MGDRVRALGAVLTLMTGCGTAAQFLPTRQLTAPPTPRAPESVEIYSAGPPVRPYVELGIIEGSQMTHLSPAGTAEILTSMRETAGANGCDALVLNGSADRDGIDFSGNSRIVKGLRGTCIVWSAPADGHATAGGTLPH